MPAENTPGQFLKPFAAVSEKLVQDFARQSADSQRALVEQWQANMSRIARDFAKMVLRLRPEIPEGIRKLAERVQALEYLYDHGWIVSPFMYGKPISEFRGHITYLRHFGAPQKTPTPVPRP